jgi:hypothetical protein
MDKTDRLNRFADNLYGDGSHSQIETLQAEMIAARTALMRQNIDFSARVAELERKVRDLQLFAALLALGGALVLWRLWDKI